MMKLVFLGIFSGSLVLTSALTYYAIGVSTPKIVKQKSVRRSSRGHVMYHGGYRHGK
jgi:hypothetical protein